MKLFEFILVMVSLVLAIAMTHLLEGVGRVLRRRSQFSLDLTTAFWAAFLFVLAIGHWWSLWGMRDADWTFPVFFFVLLPPTLLFLAVRLLVPEDSDETVALADAFMEIRVAFFTILILFMLLVTWDGFLLGTEGAWNRLRIAQFTQLGLSVIGLLSRRIEIQRWVAATALVVLLASVFVLRYLPGAFEGG